MKKSANTNLRVERASTPVRPDALYLGRPAVIDAVSHIEALAPSS